MDLTKNIADNLNAWMGANPSLDTIKKVSARSGVGFGTVQRAKNGDGNTTIKNLSAISAAFGKPVEELLAAPSGFKIAQSVGSYYPSLHDMLEHLASQNPDDIDIYIKELELAALKARREQKEKSDRQAVSGPGDPSSEGRRTA